MSAAQPVRGSGRSGRASKRRAAVRRLIRAISRFRSPARTWTVKRRLMACAALAAAAFALATFAWRVLDAGSRTERAAEIQALERRVHESRIKLSGLPRLREAVGAARVSPRAAVRPPGGEWQAVVDLAARTGVKLRVLEPAARAAAGRGRQGETAERALRLEGRTDFAGLYAFVQGLSALPVLVVPRALDIKREPDGLAFEATLNVLDRSSARLTLATGASNADAGGPPGDPFHVGDAFSSPEASAARLVGLLQGGRQALALFERASGVQAALATPGQMLGAEKIVSIDTFGVTLSGQGGVRRLSWPENGR
ncbi:hypothetical protein [Trinickia sp.]|uniref:hypothetical protein n=1 Tax=Trinickia sp. TaxID=2571163 RepID=UPI003F7D23D3